MNNSSEQQAGVLSSLVIRNLLFLTGALVFLLWPFPAKLLAAITTCNNCACTDSANDQPGAFCSDTVVCSENPNYERIDTVISADQCPNKFPTVFNEANITGKVGWSSVLVSSVGTSISYNRVCHSFSATIPCVGPPVLTGSMTTDYSCCSPPPPPPPPPPPDPCCACRYKGKQQQNGFEVLKARSPCCTCDCPIIIDTSGKGFDLTSATNGVRFDMSGTASPVQTSWTALGAQNAFLCLPDSNGACDDGKDLFGNFTPQPPSQTPNGYLALAVYDLPANGGNGDGIIDAKDAIFSQLRLWIDRNHDGISQPDEIYTLPALGVYSISLNYKEDRKVDQYGNLFRYRAQVNAGDPTSTGRMAYDVFFITTPTTITKNTPRSLIPADAEKCPAPAKGAMPVNER